MRDWNRWEEEDSRWTGRRGEGKSVTAEVSEGVMEVPPLASPVAGLSLLMTLSAAAQRQMVN